MAILRGLLLCTAAMMATGATISSAPAPWSAAERRLILAMSPVPPAPRDATNRLSGDPAATALGRRLFFNARLSASGLTSCASCHDPAFAFSDPSPLHAGDNGKRQHRHASSILDMAHSRWFFWEGRRDTLWGQALEAIETDMAGTPARAARLLLSDDAARTTLSGLMGKPIETLEDRQLFVLAGKAIAAYVETLRSEPGRFDRYVASLKAGRAPKADAASERGLRVFLGRGNCVACHTGPLLTDGEFHDVKLPPGPTDSPEDAGRFVGLYQLRAATYSASSSWSDDPHGERASLSALQVHSRENWGMFKTPSLRGVGKRTHFMHDGRFASLEAVIDHYSETPGATSLVQHADPANPQVAIRLSEEEKRDLLAFLRSL